MAGVPWFAEGGSGAGAVSFGYVLGMILASTVVGALARRGADRSVPRMAGTMLVGSAIIYAIGVPYLAYAADISASAAIAAGLTLPDRRRPQGSPGDGSAAHRLEAHQALRQGQFTGEARRGTER